MNVLENEFYGNSIQTWITALSVLVVSYVVLRAVKGIVAGRLAGIARETKTHIDDLVVKQITQTRNWFLLILSFYIGSQFIYFAESNIQVLKTITVMAAIVQIGFWGNGFINFWIFKQGSHEKNDAEVATNINVLGYVLKVALWAIILVLTLDNIPGVEVNSLIASLGIGGIAVALAVQNILSDLFASLSIALDKPFMIGDQIEVDDISGYVEKIGLNSTRIRSLTGEEIVISNSDLLKNRIRNYKSMEQRRVQFQLGIANETPYSKLKDIPSSVQSIIESQEDTTFVRAYFKEFGDFSLVFEVIYLVESSDMDLYRRIQQSIILMIIQKFEKDTIGMPYPTQTVLLEK
ncbi:mechanosensitive ion channel family protein [Chloroflexota bacterium]